ncbi:MAG: biosynthetic arginine decarboxylase [Bdellovibrionales bacterium]|nr:biosynthetic arginine decarboxylase [Bdellovibrionales bacterium]
MENKLIEEVEHIYGIDSWGKKYFSVNEQGHLCVQATAKTESLVDVYQVVQELQKQNVQTPVLLRFPQILKRRIQKLHECFEQSIEEFQYEGQYLPVFPIKVNQQKIVVESLIRSGKKFDLGIEAGSKPELITALGQDISDQALTICNGFKDQQYMNLASLGVTMGRKIVVVIEKPFELKYLLHLKKQNKPIPYIGFRIKLLAKGSGLWEKSGGTSSKFGLTTMQLIQSLEWLKEHDLLPYLRLLHFHIGSQITEIRKIKAAIREAARVYAKVKKMGVDIQYLDVGGGLGVDYDGSKTSSDASVNYTVAEYANDVVYTVKEVCNEESVPHPYIITESGRALTTHHSMLIMDARDMISENKNDDHVQKFDSKKVKQKVIEDLHYISNKISVKNFREYYHDAVEKRDEMQSLFNLGMLDIQDRAFGEWLFNQISQKTVKFSKSAKFVADEFVELEEKLHNKIVCNFSVFQSIPDHWALDQLFPIVPIHRLNEKPTQKATIVDITCDSDGEIEKFVDLKDIKHALEIHDFNESAPYYLGILMIGSYQDTMGDVHNLFGTVNQAEVFYNDEAFTIQNIQKGETSKQTIEMFGYKPEQLIANVEQKLTEKDAQFAKDALTFYKNAFDDYTYLGL